ncbi:MULTISPECIES: N-acetyl-gamma-glutamyl-phosphate reductase [Brevibacterium]|uniref:N-acetyl-gamma-glutamyl-phosphate reductase n=1 Tax=Brevibacterium antiquum CNRZ 918 TaxID=1255637 RepID=A0A2H1KY72_9MICO|nr:MULTISPECIES: N-acetyl-gamma-glutamyl-phosphate reductase [Brevibacterium]SMY04599.1 N-acetyl-gamma-glutamyl-phosphate reductase [Brevibacterium antiquum CNRZ 918]HCG56515.1 N-acetyl-gamma-glutamyl-phosphate reductase [Brevibacterium sp.]
MNDLTVAVSGATGYAGGEVLRLLSTHPHLNVTTVCGHSSVGETLGRHQPHLARYSDFVVKESTAEVLAGHDVVILALPHGQSRAIAAELEQSSPETLIVDLAADHRLISATAWEKFYGSTHQGTWTYGLPELLTADGTKQREALKTTKRIAVPGCNVTAVTLGLAPLVQAGLAAPAGLNAVLANGVSGAGKALKPHLTAAEVLGDASSYGTGGIHRHVPEIEQNLNGVLGADAADGPTRISFTPTLVPMARGILATITAEPGESAPKTAEGLLDAAALKDQLGQAFDQAYADEPFVRVLPEGQWPRTSSTTGSNLAHIQFTVDERAGTILVVVALDNLVRGTAGQALQSIHLALGLDETIALPLEGVAP